MATSAQMKGVDFKTGGTKGQRKNIATAVAPVWKSIFYLFTPFADVSCSRNSKSQN